MGIPDHNDCMACFAGILSPKTGESPLEQWVGSYKERMKCFKTPHYVNLKVDEVLRMPYDGWTNISQGINRCKYGFLLNDAIYTMSLFK